MTAIFDFAKSKNPKGITHLYRLASRFDHLEVVRACLGRWIILREAGREGGRTAYVAVAKVSGLRPDMTSKNWYLVDLSDYIDFPTPVPLRSAAGYFENKVQKIPRFVQIGVYFQNNSVRLISDQEFDAITAAGFMKTESLLINGGDITYSQNNDGLLRFGFAEDAPVARARQLSDRLFRDASFRLVVCKAYQSRCAVTGSDFHNARQQAEVEAAHILPVQSDGPDSITNGIALSRTMHWFFDNHLISVADDWRILIHPSVRRGMISHTLPVLEYLSRPSQKGDWPSQVFLADHRRQYEGHLASDLEPNPFPP